MQVVRPLIMGVVNVTPDSFSDGGRYLDHAAASPTGAASVGRGRRLGRRRAASPPGPGPSPCRSTRSCAGSCPWSRPWPPTASRCRSTPARPTWPGPRSPPGPAWSTTCRPRWPRSPPPAASRSWPCTCSATPAPCRTHPAYDDVVAEVRDFLVDRADAARAAGVAEVWIDPGIGFGKTLAHNLDLLANLDVLVATGYPVLVGTSRKAMLGTLAARADGAGAAVPPAGRPARGLGRHRGVGAAARARRWCGSTTWRRPCGRAAAHRGRRGCGGVKRRQGDLRRGSHEGQVGPGHHAPQLRVGAQGPAGRVRAARRLRRRTTAASAARRRSSGSASRASPT